MSLGKEPRIIPRKMAFCERKISYSTIEKAYHFFGSVNAYPLLTYQKIKDFLDNNAIQEKMMVIKIIGLDSIFFTTIIMNPDSAIVQTYQKVSGFNRILHTVTVKYPDLNNEICDPDLLQNTAGKIISYGLINSLAKFGDRWIL